MEKPPVYTVEFIPGEAPATIPATPETSDIWEMKLGDFLTLASQRIVRDSMQLKGVGSRSIYDRRLDLYKLLELMDPRLNRKTLMRARIRITVEAYPFSGSLTP